ncbi:MAG: N-6 DNA methylase [Polyangiaceae bacterium]|nr:N-6 DNA methylase [Polyangiaceae bacterium]
MPISWDDIRANAIAFSRRWRDACNEDAQAQNFVADLLQVFGVEEPSKVGEFEAKVQLADGTWGYIDYLWRKTIAFEMKSRRMDLDGAFRQLRNHMAGLPLDDIPDLWLVCDFASMRLCWCSENKFIQFKTKDLHKHVKHFTPLAGYAFEPLRGEDVEVNVKAAENMAKLHDAIRDSGIEGRELEIYLVRLLFCMFAEDTGIFPTDSFRKYVEGSQPNGSDLSSRLAALFEVLNMPEDMRSESEMSDDVKSFRFINGDLFRDRSEIADFDEKVRRTLIDCVRFDWGGISPAVFGAMFQGVMDKRKRRETGAHYTSEENIRKLINPLFMDDLWAEFNRVKTDPHGLDEFHVKLAGLKFLDPACGCGNFLITAYRELRMLELEVLKLKTDSALCVRDIGEMVKVSVEQFYGIECEDFPCLVAQVGMWLVDHQMNNEVSVLFGRSFARLPLAQSPKIVHGNALRMDWEDVVSKHELSYILGNPPFVGHQWRTAEQVADMKMVFSDSSKAGKLDYVCCWYKKSTDFMRDTDVRAAFVSTNSIVQGESVAAMWKPFMDGGFDIGFARAPFAWTNDANGKAAVHCVIIGFARSGVFGKKRIYSDDTVIETTCINGYLLPGPSVFLRSRGKPLVKNMPEMSKGSQPTDGGHLILSSAEREELLSDYPEAARWVRRYMNSEDMINNKVRYCLWLKGVPPSDYRSIKPIMERLQNVAKCRSDSPTASVRRDAATPMLFTQIRQPDSRYLAVPEVSSDRRRYIPIGYFDLSVIASNMIYVVPDASLYLFGMLTSSVHMAWMRVVCGRLGMGYRYTPSVYHNFPFPRASDLQKRELEGFAQGVLNARLLFSGWSFADLYDPVTMPIELLRSHQDLDRAVMKLYGFSSSGTTEAHIVSALMEMYRALVG